jgi:hypothetical protein
MRWVGAAACMGEIRNTYKILGGKCKQKRSLRRRRHRWEDDIKMNFRKM